MEDFGGGRIVDKTLGIGDSVGFPTDFSVVLVWESPIRMAALMGGHQ